MKQSTNQKLAKLTRQGVAFLLALVLMTSAFVPGITARAAEGSDMPPVVEEEETLTLEKVLENPLTNYETSLEYLADLDTLVQELNADSSNEDCKALYDAILEAQTLVEELPEEVALSQEQENEFAAQAESMLAYLTDELGYEPEEDEEPETQSNPEPALVPSMLADLEPASDPVCNCPEGTEGHMEGCTLYVAPCEVCGETGTHKADCATLCNCPEGTESHIEGCPLYVAPCEVCGETGTHKADCATLCNCPEGTEGHIEGCPLYVAPCEVCGQTECICGLESAYLLNGAVIYKEQGNAESGTQTITGWNTHIKIKASHTAEDGTVWYEFTYANVISELFNGYNFVKATDTTVHKCICTEAPAADGEHQTDCPLYVELTPYQKAMKDLTALEEEAKHLADELDPDADDYIEKLTEKCNDFDDRLFELLLLIEDMYMAEPPAITEEEYNAAGAKYAELLLYLKNTYGYENREITSFVEVDSVEATAVTGVDVKLFNYGSAINSHPDIIKNPNADAAKLADTKIMYGRYEFYNTYNDAKDGKVTEDNVYRPNYDDKNQTLSHTNLRPMKSNTSFPGGKFPEQDFDVAPLLKNGYPELTSWPATENPTSFGTMGYLFEEGATGQNGVTHVATMEEGGGLFQLDEDGYYEYHAQKNAAYYDEETNEFILSKAVLRPSYYADKEWSEGAYNMGHFLPFNSITEVNDANTLKTSDDGIASYALPNVSESLDMWFGMTVEFDFVMTKDGKVPDADGNLQDMTFMFEGDDDVLVFIDDVLILNIAGMHSPQDAWVNFANGQIYDQHVSNSGTLPDARTTIRERFAEAGKTDAALFNGDTFADYTTHKLKFFYLERGSSLAGCRLRFNLQTLPENSLSVTKSVKNDSNPNAKAFDFQVSFKDANNNALSSVSYIKNGTPGSMTLSGGVGNFKLKNNDMITFELNAGVQYTVEELSANKNNYTTTVSGAESGTLSGSPAMVTYTNTLETGGIERDKYVTEGDELGDYTIHLEAYATGQISSVTKAKPTDIVIAFDHSGSMLRALNYAEGTISNFNLLDPVKGSIPGYYIAHGATQVAFPFFRDGKWYYVGVNEALNINDSLVRNGYNAKSFDIPFDPDHFTGNKVQELTDGVINNFNNGGIWQTRFGAAYDALSGFVEKTAATGVDHNIAIVTFAKDTNYGTGMFVNGSYKQYQYGLNEADFKNAFMSVQNQKDMILSCVDDLYSGWSHTYMHAGLQMAENIFKNNPITDNSRDRMVVVINDGLPTLEDISETPITVAGRLKDEQKAKIYSIGALAPTEASGIALLEKVSSNYSSAGSKVADKYFVNAANAETMDNMFDQIVTDTSGTQVELNEYTILRDTLSEHFELDESRDIKVYTADCAGVDSSGAFTWKEPVQQTVGQLIPEHDQGCTQTLEVTVTEPAAGKKANERIDVKGFDYSLNYVAVSGSTARGKKLIVEIPVTMDPDNVGGTKQPTNIQAESGLYDPTDPDPIIDFPLPHADTPARINVIKMVDGNLGDRSQSFSFTAIGTLAMYDKLNTDDYYVSMDNATVGNSNYLNHKTANLDATFSLTHSHSWAEDDNAALINQPYEMLVPGVEITITENNIPEGYELAVTAKDKDGKTVTVTQNQVNGKVNGATFVVEPGMTITFTNTKEVDIDTGIALDSIPYIVILVGVAAVAGFFCLRKRRYED